MTGGRGSTGSVHKRASDSDSAATLSTVTLTGTTQIGGFGSRDCIIQQEKANACQERSLQIRNGTRGLQTISHDIE
jgi:hypothetical protein